MREGIERFSKGKETKTTAPNRSAATTQDPRRSAATAATTATPTVLGKLEAPCETKQAAPADRRESFEKPRPTIELPLPLEPTSAVNMVRSAGRLAQFFDNWTKLTSDPVVLEAVKGYKIPFTSLPPPRPFLQEPKLPSAMHARCSEEIDRLTKKGAIVQVEPSADQFLSTYFLVEKPSGGVRFIFNLKDLNYFIDPPHFKLEDWRTVVRLMLPGMYMASIDIEDAYLLVPIHPSHRRFLRFQWNGSVFEFQALPFGLSTAPYIFTKIMRPVTTALRESGFESVVYLDDFLILSPTKDHCRSNVQAHINQLSSLGFIINFNKSVLDPSTSIKYLGFIFDSVHQTLAIPNERRLRLLSMIAEFAQRRRSLIQEFASIIGSLVSICPAVRYGLLYTKQLEREKFLALCSSNNNYSARMNIPKELKTDFDWWIRILSDNTQANAISTGNYVREIFSDASLTGWGASWGLQRAHGWWSAENCHLHINALELKAAFFALKCFASDLRDCEVLLRVDNTTALSYLNRFGSVRYPHLSSLARDIWQWCEERGIVLFSSYIASAENVHADRESRRSDTDTEWSLSEYAFAIIDSEFGPFDVDLFASMLNHKCPLYVSWIPDPESWVVDAFTISWTDLKFYAFPPFILVPRVLRKIVDDKAEGILVVPWWPSQPWFPLFQRLLLGEPLILHPTKDLLISPLRNQHPAHKTLSLGVGRLSGCRI